MWKKVIFALVLVVFVGVQLANSLNCYSCNSPESCRNPTLQLCTNQSANASSYFLAVEHANVPKSNGSDTFRCGSLDYFYLSNNTYTYMFRGCVFPNVSPCLLRLRSGSFDSRYCATCNFDKCNGNGNPAGTFSGSLYTIMGSVMALLLAKLLH